MPDKPQTTEFCEKYLGIKVNPILEKIFGKAEAGEKIVFNQPPAHLGRLIREAEEATMKFIKENL